MALCQIDKLAVFIANKFQKLITKARKLNIKTRKLNIKVGKQKIKIENDSFISMKANQREEKNKIKDTHISSLFAQSSLVTIYALFKRISRVQRYKKSLQQLVWFKLRLKPNQATHSYQFSFKARPTNKKIFQPNPYCISRLIVQYK